MQHISVDIKDKALLTLEEASAYFGIGVNKLREMTDGQHNPFVIWLGRKRLIKKKMLEAYLEKAYVI